MSRRRFLGRAAGLGASAWAFPALVPARAFGAADRVRVGFIGVRNQGTNNLKALLSRDDAEVAALCDVDRDVLAAASNLVSDRLGRVVPSFHDYRELLDRPDIDAVLITTPDHWHALPTVHACQAGKDVYCEKPLSLTVAEGRTMATAARTHDRVVQTGSQQRSAPEFRRAAEAVRNGRLGTIRSITVGLPGVNFDGPAVPDAEPPAALDYNFWLGPAPDRPYNPKQVHYLFRFFWPYSGGQMTNFGAHHLDIVQWALGRDDSGPVHVEPVSVEYHPEGWYEVPRTSEVVYTYDDGVRVRCRQGLGDPSGIRFEGTEGSIFVARGRLQADPEELLSEPSGPDAVRLEESRDHHQNWIDCIRERRRPICDVEVGHRSATLCHLGNIAARLGRSIRWDPDRETIPGDSEAGAMLSRPYRKPWALDI
ncbi:Gfo/Idh/MocA family protein [Tautonia sociabilis]|uniref:Gfo/Idh/MocA family protein n=1 Tax=Tautonia sociabilis TaxID=2080755 RepID=UPI001F2C078A|nr:Gfo/Idh/MocA family oxidoreductase [Tautonia sociabilis]